MRRWQAVPSVLPPRATETPPTSGGRIVGVTQSPSFPVRTLCRRCSRLRLTPLLTSASVSPSTPGLSSSR
eukprot:10120534-Lingulodinium_polyedra.AAC.1